MARTIRSSETAVPRKGIKRERVRLVDQFRRARHARRTTRVAMVTPVNATDNPADPESAEEKPKVRAIHPRRARPL